MSDQIDKEQVSLNAVTTWFHVLHSMVESGEIGDMQCGELKVYLIIKSYINFNSGDAFPAIKLIAEKAGISERQTMRSIKLLEDRGRLMRKKSSTGNIYTLREKIECKTNEGKLASIVSFDYLPSRIEKARTELSNYLEKNAYDKSIIFIEKIIINHNEFLSPAVQINGDVVPDNLPEKLKNTLKSIGNSVRKRSE